MGPTHSNNSLISVGRWLYNTTHIHVHILYRLSKLVRAHIVGVNLSELHTSGTALWECVYAYLLTCLQPYSINFKWAHSKWIFHEDQSCTWSGLWGLLPKCKCQQLGAKLKHAWKLLVCVSTIYQQQAASQAVQIWTVIEVASGWDCRASYAWHEQHS